MCAPQGGVHRRLADTWGLCCSGPGVGGVELLTWGTQARVSGSPSFFCLFPSLSPLPLLYLRSTYPQAGHPQEAAPVCSGLTQSCYQKALSCLLSCTPMWGGRETGCWLLRTRGCVHGVAEAGWACRRPCAGQRVCACTLRCESPGALGRGCARTERHLWMRTSGRASWSRRLCGP